MVYVDPLATTLKNRKWPWSHGCHLYADSLVELHAFAGELGLPQRWFQNRQGFPHYDLVDSKRIQAVQLGAREHNRKEMVEWVQLKKSMASEC